MASSLNLLLSAIPLDSWYLMTDTVLGKCSKETRRKKLNLFPWTASSHSCELCFSLGDSKPRLRANGGTGTFFKKKTHWSLWEEAAVARDSSY